MFYRLCITDCIHISLHTSCSKVNITKSLFDQKCTNKRKIKNKNFNFVAYILYLHFIIVNLFIYVTIVLTDLSEKI